MQERRKLLLLGILTGVCCGLAGVFLISVIDLLKVMVFKTVEKHEFNWTVFFFPGLGMLISLLLVRYLIRDDIGHGVTKVLQAVSTNESRIKSRHIWSSLLTSAVTIGLGGSVGAEAPIVYSGAAIGSNIGTRFKLSHRNVTILLGCGAAGAIAAVFKAPFAGLFFTIEILLFNVSMSSMAPLLLSTISATIVSYLFLGKDAAFACNPGEFSMRFLPFCILLGAVSAFAGLYFLRMTLWMEDKLKQFKNVFIKWFVCAIALGALIFFLPPLYGEGYDVLRSLLNGSNDNYAPGSPFESMVGSGWGVPLFFLAVLLLKIFSMTFTNAGGGVGGTFGPTLFVGGIVGFVVARSLNMAFGMALPESSFVLIGMAGSMASVMQAPLTAIFLVAEASGCHGLLLPLTLCATVSFALVRFFEKYSIYSKRIAQTGELLTHDDDQAVITLMKTKDLIRDKYPRVSPDDSLKTLVSTISSSTAAVVAVVDKAGCFRGLINVEDVRMYLLNPKKYSNYNVSDISAKPQTIIYEDEKMDSVMDKFDKTQAWRLPVVTSENIYLGFISRSRILMAYRERLKEFSQD